MSTADISSPLSLAGGVGGGPVSSVPGLDMPSPNPSRLREGDIRADFPGLPPGWHYLDTAATAQKPQAVIDATVNAMGRDYATVHRGVYARSADMTLAYEAARRRIAAFIGATEEQIAFVRGAASACTSSRVAARRPWISARAFAASTSDCPARGPAPQRRF